MSSGAVSSVTDLSHLSNLELVKRYLHKELIIFIKGGGDSIDKFKENTRAVVEALSFNGIEIAYLYEKAREVLLYISEAKAFAAKHARGKVLRDLGEVKEH